jgi:hypothetical protein
MKRFSIIAIAALLSASPAIAQTANGRVTTVAPTYTNGLTSPLSLDTAGGLRISGAVSTGGLTDAELRATPVPVSGPLTDAELRAVPVPVSGTVATTGPFLTDAELRATAVDVDVTATVGLTDTELRATAVAVTPETPAGASAKSGTSTSAAADNLVIKASAGNLYSAYVTATTAGYFMLFNATTEPADGSVTPVHCAYVPANSSVSLYYGDIPEAFGTGITAVFSSTGCFTKTGANAAFIRGDFE